MRNGATTLPPSSGPAAAAPAPLPELVSRRLPGPPPGPRSAGLPAQEPLLRRAPRVRRTVDLDAGTVVEAHGAGRPVATAPAASSAVDLRVPSSAQPVDETALSIQDRVRLRAQEAAQLLQVAPWPGSTPSTRYPSTAASMQAEPRR